MEMHTDIYIHNKEMHFLLTNEGVYRNATVYDKPVYTKGKRYPGVSLLTLLQR